MGEEGRASNGGILHLMVRVSTARAGAWLGLIVCIPVSRGRGGRLKQPIALRLRCPRAAMTLHRMEGQEAQPARLLTYHAFPPH